MKVFYFSVVCIHFKSVFLPTYWILFIWMYNFLLRSFQVRYQPLLGRKATDTTSTNFTVLTGQKTGWISVGFKLKPVTGLLSLLVMVWLEVNPKFSFPSFGNSCHRDLRDAHCILFGHPLTRWNFSYFGYCKKEF